MSFNVASGYSILISKHGDKGSEKSQTSAKKIQVSLIYSQILLKFRAKRHLKHINRHKNYNQIRKACSLPKKNRTRIVFPSPSQATAILLPYCLVCQEYGYSMGKSMATAYNSASLPLHSHYTPVTLPLYPHYTSELLIIHLWGT